MDDKTTQLLKLKSFLQFAIERLEVKSLKSFKERSGQEATQLEEDTGSVSCWPRIPSSSFEYHQESMEVEGEAAEWSKDGLQTLQANKSASKKPQEQESDVLKEDSESDEASCDQRETTKKALVKRPAKFSPFRPKPPLNIKLTKYHSNMQNKAEASCLFENLTFDRSFFCPLCFMGFDDKTSLGDHFQLNCNVVEDGLFHEPSEFSLFQIVSNGINCTECKTKIGEPLVDEHRREVHPDKLVGHIFCSICREYLVFSKFEVNRHRYSSDHQELCKIRLDQRRPNKIQLLRQTSYCLTCKVFLPFFKLAKHVSSGTHSPKGPAELWCYYCEMCIQPHNVISHCKEETHVYNTYQRIYCVFCSQFLKLPFFIEHVIACVTENSTD